VADTVLIATPDCLGLLRTHADFSAALTFPDSDTVAALEAITARRPKLVALERLFAASARGAALINRIRMDPALTSCEIRIVAHDAGPHPQAPLSVAVPEPAPPMGPPAWGVPDGLDAHGTRTAQRFEMPANFEVMLDGNPGRLIDLSVGGAQLSTTLSLKPGQRVRLALPGAPRPLRLSATVQWAKFEMPTEGPRYRAGVRFLEADGDTLARFIDAHRS
jgi:hypothetical protein